MGAKIDLTGQRFGRLEVIRQIEQTETEVIFTDNCSYWLCKCECGREKVVSSEKLRKGKVKSCGCLKKENEQVELTMKQVTDTIEILPCPFCGKPAKLTTLFYDKSRHAVQCTRCNVRTDFYNEPLVAVRVWNIRHKE